MDDYVGLIQYLKGLFNDLINRYVSLGYEYADINLQIYYFLINDSTNLSEFEENYINCEESVDIDKKDNLVHLLFAIYYLVSTYNESLETNHDENQEYDLKEENIQLVMIKEALMNNDNETLNYLFQNEDLGIDIIDNFSIYLEFTEARRKKIASSLVSDENFMDICNENEFLATSLLIDLNLEVSEEAVWADNIARMYENVCDYNIGDDFSNLANVGELVEEISSDNKSFNKIKKELILKSLIHSIPLNDPKRTIKHIFCIMVKSVYSNIFCDQIENLKMVTNKDYEFFKMVNDPNLSVDDLFLRFVHDENFSSYLIGSFYIKNVDKDSVDFEYKQRLCDDNQVNEKLKKYNL